MTVLLVLLLLVLPAQAKSNIDSNNPGQFVDGTSLGRAPEAIALARYNRQNRPAALSSVRAVTTSDRGNIAVLEDDGTILSRINFLDLANRSLTLSPAGANRYSVVSQATVFDDGAGSETVLSLADDDAAEVQLPFPFMFYGTVYTSLFINSDGNLTFGAPDTATSPRNLSRMSSGPPRISPLFDDLNPGASGRIAVEKLADRVLLTWTGIGEWANGNASSGQNTFQAVLNQSGVISFNFKRLDAFDAVVGIAPGQSVNAEPSLVDLSAQTTPVTLPGLIAEVFSTTQNLDLSQIGTVFYRTHPDAYDGLIVFTDFSIDLSGAFAYAVPLRNHISGIMNTVSSDYDFGRQFGSAQQLAVLVNMGDVSRYPTDPKATFLGTNNSLSVLGQEFGHRWLAYLDIGTPKLLGRDSAHWSFLHNTFGSVMEGNEIEDLGRGSFRTTAATVRYSPLDQYVMGLRPAAEVPPWFVVANPVLSAPPAIFPTSCRNAEVLPSCAPFVGLQFSGTRQDVSIGDIISRVGPRVPAYEESPKAFRVAFVLVTRSGTQPKDSSIRLLDDFRTQWEPYFNVAVDGRATMNTAILYPPPQITSITPARGSTEGGTTITIIGSGFLPDSTVTVGERKAETVFLDGNTLRVIVPPRNEGAGAVGVVVSNPRDGQSSTLNAGFTYVLPAGAEVLADITRNGSRHIETTGLSASTQVGYATLDSAIGIAVVRSIAGGEVRSEAAIPAATIGTAFRVYAERTANTSTGLALLNTAETAASITLQLSNGLQTSLQMAPRTQKSQFVNELFPNLENTFSGTLSVVSNVAIGLVALRGSLNERNEFIITTVPSSTASSGSATLLFPQIADGSGYVTELILINPTAATITGSIEFSFSAITDRGTNTKFNYEIATGGAWKMRTSGTLPGVQVGFAALVPASGSASPAATAVLKQSTGTNLNFEAGVPAAPGLTRGVMFAVSDGMHRSVLALANRGSAATSVSLTAYRANGTVAVPAKTISLAANEHLPRFLDELIPEIAGAFEGTVVLESTSPVYAITLRTLVNTSGTFLMTAMPVIDLNQSRPSGTNYFPQLVDGGNYTTEFLLMSPDATTSRLRFFDLNGAALAVPLQ